MCSLELTAACFLCLSTADQADGLCFRLTRPCPKAAPTRYELSYSMKDQYEVSRDSLEKKELLGAGNFGEVWRGVCLQIQFEADYIFMYCHICEKLDST